MSRDGSLLSRYALPIAVILLSALAGLLIPLMSGNRPRGATETWNPPTVTTTPTAVPTSEPIAAPPSPSAEPTQEVVVQPAATATPVPTATPQPEIPSAEPTVAPTVAPTVVVTVVVTVAVMAEVSGDGLNLRAGPATGQTPLGTANTGDRFTVLARSADSKWLQVCCLNEQPVWLASAYVKLDGSLDAVPVAP